ncbi:MAG: hypothetical protein H6712_18960 [Myxococcales bacterium]|nr:hypothetical protein [Myxococcales bacterium]MCB9715955.1 hypothetical protein [Myxococcales bacterium]
MERKGRARGRERAPLRKHRRRRIIKRWPAEQPGTIGWCATVRKLGVSVEPTDEPHDLHADGDSWEDVDPHAFYLGLEDSPAEHVVSYMLLAYHVPEYASLMYVVHKWEEAGRSLKEWLVAAYAWMIDQGDDRHREAALYSLWVDYFEVPKRASFVFPRLWRRLWRRDELLAASGPVPWEHKRAAYQEAARDPELHSSLARGLVGSFHDAFGQVDPVEARELYRAITIEDDEVRAALESVLFTPTRWRVVALITVDVGDPRWRKWVPEDVGPSFLVELAAVDRPRWVHRSDLLHGERWLGSLMHWAFPFDEGIGHQREEVPHEGAPPILFRVEGYAGAVRDVLGEVVDAWPPGLGPRDEERRPTAR